MGWLTILGVGIAAAVFLGSVVVYLRGSRDQGTIATLERSNKALTERVTVLEGEAARSAVERDRDAARITALEHENESLRAERPSAEAIANLAVALARHDADLKGMVSALMLKGTEE